MAKVEISLDAALVVEVMVLSGVNNPQDAVEVIVRDYIAHGHRTEAVTGHVDRRLKDVESRPQRPAEHG
jgi:Arc/MetJ family transcription regulator